MSYYFSKLALFSVAVCVQMLALVPAPAAAQLQIKNEDVTVKFGVQGRFRADWTQDATAASAGTQGYRQNFYLRRARLMMGGDIGNEIGFFVETDSPNPGKTPKAITSGFILQDAFLEWKPTKVFQLDGGLFIVPFSHNALQSTLSYYTIDLSSLATIDNSSTKSAALRDAGFQARGFFVNDHLQYRVGAFQGEKDANGRNSLRSAGYLQYDFRDTGTGYTLAGAALGKKKLLAIDAGAETQGGYRAFSANAACGKPVRGGDEIGGQVQYYHYDGRQKFTSIADQNAWFVEGAYYVHKVKVHPFAKFERQMFVAAVNNTKNINRAGGGVNYYFRGQNMKWTAQATRALQRVHHPNAAVLFLNANANVREAHDHAV